MLLVFSLVLMVTSGALHQSVASSVKQYDGYKVLNVVPENQETLSFLNHLMNTDIDIDFWQEPTKVGAAVHMMVAPQELPRIEARLRASSIHYTIHIDNVQTQLTQQWNDIAKRSLNGKKMAFDIDDYNTIEDIYTWLDDLVGRCRQGLVCEVYSAGNSYEGRPLQIFKISKTGADRKAYFVDATIHAREWIATATSLKILDHLATGGDADAIALTDDYDWYFLPVVNPDGYAYSWSNERLWRKNRTPNIGSICDGTDLNRNFNYTWGKDGVSFNPCSATFCGQSAGSEPETVVVSAELNSLASTLEGIVTLHSYGQYWLFSYGTTVNFAGVTCQRAPDHDQLMVVANAAANAIEKTYNTNWLRGNSCETIYPTSGSTQDYGKGASGVKYSFTPELRGNSFIIPASNIPESFNEIWNGVVAMVNAINAVQ